MPVKAYQPGEMKVIRGPVVQATVLLYKGPSPRANGEVAEAAWPVQTNNMTAWFVAAYNTLGQPMRSMVGRQRDLEYIVNDGEGAKKGRGSHENKFTYIIRDGGLVEWRLDVVIRTEPFPQRHARRIASGHIPKKKVDWTGLTYLDTHQRVVFQWMDDTTMPEGGYYVTHRMEDYYKEHPEWRGKLPAKGIVDPDDVRSGKWIPNG